MDTLVDGLVQTYIILDATFNAMLISLWYIITSSFPLYLCMFAALWVCDTYVLCFQQRRRIHYVFVEGCISAGKSVMLERVAPRLRAMGMQVIDVPEPLERWRNCHGHNVLDMFYRDQARWALAFQIHAMSTRVAAVRQAIEASEYTSGDVVVLCERSVYTDRYVFVEMLHTDGVLSDAERAMYETAFDYYSRHAYPGHETGVVYLRAEAERCAKHMRKRARTEEDAVPLDYLRRLVERHDVAVPAKWNGSALTLDVATLGNVPDDDAAADKCTATLYDFITKAIAAKIGTTDADDE